VVLAAAGCGCARSDRLPLIPVGGVVTLDGKPLGGAAIGFAPIGTTPGNGASGRTDKDGKYELTASYRGKGVPPGEYRVVVTKLVMPDGSEVAVGPSLIPLEARGKQIVPARYSNLMRTELKATVHNGDNRFDFTLSSKP
jgi:hypothetical protein